MNAWYLYERETGLGLGDKRMQPRAIRALLWALMQERQSELSLHELGKMDLGNMRRLTQTAVRALNDGLPTGGHPSEAEVVKTLDWMEMAAFAFYDLGLSEEQFWAMSPRFFHALVERYDTAIERHFLASSIVAAAITNCHIDPEKSGPVDPLLFSPTKLGLAARESMDKEKRAGLCAKIIGLRNVFQDLASIGEINGS